MSGRLGPNQFGKPLSGRAMGGRLGQLENPFSGGAVVEELGPDQVGQPLSGWAVGGKLGPNQFGKLFLGVQWVGGWVLTKLENLFSGDAVGGELGPNQVGNSLPGWAAGGKMDPCQAGYE